MGLGRFITPRAGIDELTLRSNRFPFATGQVAHLAYPEDGYAGFV